MDALNATKPFNLAHARAGAPFACANGMEATILKWDARGKCSLIGHFGANDTACEWYPDGRHPTAELLNLVMTPLGHIDAKPVFVGDAYEIVLFDGAVEKRTAESQMRNFNCCRWPAPEKQYPVTGMGAAELLAAAESANSLAFRETYVAVANAALRHAIDNGQVVTIEAYDQLCADLLAAEQRGAARDIATAEAVRNAAKYEFMPPSAAIAKIESLDLAAIIAGVK